MEKKKTSAVNVITGILFLAPIILISFGFLIALFFALIVIFFGGTESIFTDGFAILFGSAFIFLASMFVSHVVIGISLLSKTKKPIAAVGFFILSFFSGFIAFIEIIPDVDGENVFPEGAGFAMSLVALAFLATGVMIISFCKNSNFGMRLKTIWFVPPLLIIVQILLVMGNGSIYTVLAYVYYMVTMFLTLFWYANPNGMFNQIEVQQTNNNNSYNNGQ